jgi:Spy/CpxP family protein refolding chaperone
MPQKWKVLLAFAGIFVAGSVAGGVVMLRVGVERARASSPVAPARPVRTVTVDQYGPQQLERYIKQLSLSPEQSGKITPLIEQAAQTLDELSQKNRAATLAIREDLDKQVSAVLTEAQRTKLAEMQKNRRDQFDRMNNPPTNGRGGPRGNGQRGGPGGRSGGGPQWGGSSTQNGQSRRDGSAPDTVSNSATAPGPQSAK